MIDLYDTGAPLRPGVALQVSNSGAPGQGPAAGASDKKLLKRRNAIEPVISHLKSDHRMDRCHLKGEMGDRLHAVLCAAGYNLRERPAIPP